jgi:hypothetical protein
MNVVQRQKWPWARDSFLDEPANPSVAEPDAQREHQNAYDSARAAFPDQQYTQKDEGGDKERIAADKRHDFVEKGIACGLINEPKNINV